MSNTSSTSPPDLSSTEIDELLSKILIANLATVDNNGDVHILPMWFLRIGNDICIQTSRNTHKYRNLRARPHASVMIDISLAGLNLRGVLIRGGVELAYTYLSRGDDITIKVHMDHLISWNLAGSKAGEALSKEGWFYPLDY